MKYPIKYGQNIKVPCMKCYDKRDDELIITSKGDI